MSIDQFTSIEFMKKQNAKKLLAEQRCKSYDSCYTTFRGVLPDNCPSCSYFKPINLDYRKVK